MATVKTSQVQLTMQIHHNVIYANTSASSSAGVLVFNALVKGFFNNTVTNNQTEGKAGGGLGVYLNLAHSAALHGANNIVYHNTANNISSDIEVDGGGECFLTYSCSSTDIGGPGNILSNPLFVNPGGNDYHLQNNSPCIDKGDPATPQDPDNTRADMGALYFPQGVSTKNSGDVTKGDITIQRLMDQTLILGIPKPGKYTVELYTLKGQLIMVPNTRLGINQISLDMAKVASEPLLVRIFGEYAERNRMFLVSP